MALTPKPSADIETSLQPQPQLQPHELHRVYSSRESSGNCLHGFSPPPADHICWKFLHEFMTKVEHFLVEHNANHPMEAGMYAMAEMRLLYPPVFRRASMREIIKSLFIAHGTNYILKGEAESSVKLPEHLACFFFKEYKHPSFPWFGRVVLQMAGWSLSIIM